MTMECNSYFLYAMDSCISEQYITGHILLQLAVPEERRKKMKELAHESVFGGHFAEDKTRERISLSFIWPDMRHDIR